MKLVERETLGIEQYRSARPEVQSIMTNMTVTGRMKAGLDLGEVAMAMMDTYPICIQMVRGAGTLSLCVTIAVQEEKVNMMTTMITILQRSRDG